MNELLIAIALLCQTPNGVKYNPDYVIKEQQKCHVYYAVCALKMEKMSRAESILHCMKDRK